jgi:23S rRNA (adenine2503-C2)-methyltransferase
MIEEDEIPIKSGIQNVPENLTGYDRAELEAFAERLGEKKFRGRQLFSWIYEKKAVSFAAMTDLARPLRQKLAANASLGQLALDRTLSSPRSGSTKYLFRTRDGLAIESVYIPESGRRTLCISSQVGCALKCAFCATGQIGFRRDLSAGEIVDQVIAVERSLTVELTNIVLMGMGEPLLNYDAVMKACDLIHAEEGLAIGHRHIVLSTVGIVPAIHRYTDEKRPFRLAISLHAADDDTRRQIVPIAKRYPLAELMAAVRRYAEKLRRRPTFEYVLLDGINDGEEDAQKLRRLLAGIPCKVNLIPYNPAATRFKRPDDAAVSRFAEWLAPMPAPVSVRWSKGSDIDAACGQLAGGKAQY